MARFERNKRAMLRWMCGLRPGDVTTLSDIWDKLEIVSLETALCQAHLQPYKESDKLNIVYQEL